MFWSMHTFGRRTKSKTVYRNNWKWSNRIMDWIDRESRYISKILKLKSKTKIWMWKMSHIKHGFLSSSMHWLYPMWFVVKSNIMN